MFLPVIFVSFVRRKSILVFVSCSTRNLKITVSVSANLSWFWSKVNICSFARYICRRRKEREVQPLANILVSKATSSSMLLKTYAQVTPLHYIYCEISKLCNQTMTSELLSNFILCFVQIRKLLTFGQNSRQIIPLFHEYTYCTISY